MHFNKYLISEFKNNAFVLFLQMKKPKLKEINFLKIILDLGHISTQGGNPELRVLR